MRAGQFFDGVDRNIVLTCLLGTASDLVAAFTLFLLLPVRAITPTSGVPKRVAVHFVRNGAAASYI